MSEFSIFDTPPSYLTQEETFMRNLPATLYMTHYELSMAYSKWKPDEWRRFLKEKERFIMTEVSAITEASARQALSRLATGSLSAQDNAAIRQLLERSEQINSQDRDQRTFVMLQFDGSMPQPEGMLTDKELSNIMLENDNNVRKLYGFYPSEDDPLRKRNADNTLHFTDIEKLTDLDKAYMRLFNPDNNRNLQLPKTFKPEGYDVQ